MKLVPARLADRLDIEVKEKAELRLSSDFWSSPLHQQCYHLLDWKRHERSGFGDRVVKIESHVLDLLSSG